MTPKRKKSPTLAAMARVGLIELDCQPAMRGSGIRSPCTFVCRGFGLLSALILIRIIGSLRCQSQQSTHLYREAVRLFCQR